MLVIYMAVTLAAIAAWLGFSISSFRSSITTIREEGYLTNELRPAARVLVWLGWMSAPASISVLSLSVLVGALGYMWTWVSFTEWLGRSWYIFLIGCLAGIGISSCTSDWMVGRGHFGAARQSGAAGIQPPRGSGWRWRLGYWVGRQVGRYGLLIVFVAVAILLWLRLV